MCFRGGEIIPATHFPTNTSSRILVRTTGCDTSYMGPNFVSSTQPRKPNRFVPLFRKSLPPNTSSIHVPVMRLLFAGLAWQFLCPRYLDTLRVYFQLASEWARERVVVGRQTSAFVVSCDVAESSSLTASLHCLQSSKTAHSISMLAPP